MFFVNIFYLLFYHPIIANYLYINIIIFSLFYYFSIYFTMPKFMLDYFILRLRLIRHRKSSCFYLGKEGKIHETCYH